MNKIIQGTIVLGGVMIVSASALADRGQGSIRAAARPQAPPPRAAAPPARAAAPPARATAPPARTEAPPARVEAPPGRPSGRGEAPVGRTEQRGAPPARGGGEARGVPEVRREERPAPAHVEAPVRHDWDEHDEDARHFGGFAHGAPVRITRGERIHDLPREHHEIEFNHHRFFFDDVGICYDLLPDGEYVIVQPPIGVLAPMLPTGAIPIGFGPTTYYYLDGIFYVQQGDGFTVVNPPAGIVVPMLPSGAVQVIVNGAVAYQFNGFNYLPSLQDGVTVYTVMPA